MNFYILTKIYENNQLRKYNKHMGFKKLNYLNVEIEYF